MKAEVSPVNHASNPYGNQYVGRNMIYLMMELGNRNNGSDTPLKRHMSEANPENIPKEIL